MEDPAAEPEESLTKMDVCCAYGVVNAAHVQAALMCRTCASFCHTSYSATCMLLVYSTCAARTHACYSMLHKCLLHVCILLYSAAYMLLAHMQATSVPHMCSLHTYMHITTTQLEI